MKIRGGRFYGSAPTGALGTRCPKCDAAPGHRCMTYINGRVRGEDIGAGYWKTRTTVHDERRAKQ